MLSKNELLPPTQADVRSTVDTKLCPRDLEITSHPTATSLLAALRDRRYTAVGVTTAFSRRACIVHQLTNCITEPLFTTALARARFLDAHVERTGKLYGLLHGLPISVKDCFDVEGVDSSIGIAHFCFQPAAKNAHVVNLLLDAGAVIHCKTNVPQTMLALDSVNNIFGRTLNPGNRQAWTAGGSSGGEGVLVAMGGSVMGVGTDVGGSVRIPAMCTGIVGFKPSVGRIPSGGQQTGQLAMAGKVGLESSVGVIARSVSDVGLCMEAVEKAEAWRRDAEVLPGQWWRSSQDGMRVNSWKPTVGVIWSDRVTMPLPPVKQALQKCVETLQQSGKVEVVEVKAERWNECQGLFNKLINVEGGNHIMDMLEVTGEPLIPWLDGRFKRKTPASVDSLRDLQAKRAELQNAFLSYWKDDRGKDIDVLICPMAPHPVPPPDRWNAIGYTSSWVLLDYPAASIPVGVVKKSDLTEELTGKPIGRWDAINRTLCESLSCCFLLSVHLG